MSESDLNMVISLTEVLLGQEKARSGMFIK